MPVNIFNIFDDPSASPTPNGSGTLASGINSTDQIVGEYVNGTSSHGFLLSGGTYTTIDDPSAVNETEANGINDVPRAGGQGALSRSRCCCQAVRRWPDAKLVKRYDHKLSAGAHQTSSCRSGTACQMRWPHGASAPRPG